MDADGLSTLQAHIEMDTKALSCFMLAPRPARRLIYTRELGIRTVPHPNTHTSQVKDLKVYCKTLQRRQVRGVIALPKYRTPLELEHKFWSAQKQLPACFATPAGLHSSQAQSCFVPS